MPAASITRDPARAAATDYDLIVIGGGISGVCTALEAARRGLRPLLIEQADFGGATSWNSLRIVHGGLRYLQSLDLARMRESVRERHWFCRHFPDLVAPLTCLMPLYGEGLHRPAVFRLALAVNDLVARRCNRDLPADRRLAAGRVVDAGETTGRFPQVSRAGLKGGALWTDALMTNAPRLLIEALKWACAQGATTLNYVAAEALIIDAGRTSGVAATDRLTGNHYTFRARQVINCAGPWGAQLATRFDRDPGGLMSPALAFNLLLDRPPVAEVAVAVAPREGSGRRYFLLPWHGRLYAGTCNAPWHGGPDHPAPAEPLITAFLDDLNRAVPGLALTRTDVVRVFAGLLPARTPGSAELARRPVIVNHARHGGPHGLLSVSANKYTTARLLAERVLSQALAGQGGLPPYRADSARPAATAAGLDLDDPAPLLAADDARITPTLHRLVRNEAVMQLDDLLLRRSDWGLFPPLAAAVTRKIGRLPGWHGTAGGGRANDPEAPDPLPRHG